MGFGPSTCYSLARELLVRPIEHKSLLAVLNLPANAVRDLNQGTPAGVRMAANQCAKFFNAIQHNSRAMELFIKLSGAPVSAAALLEFCGARPANYDAERLRQIISIMGD